MQIVEVSRAVPRECPNLFSRAVPTSLLSCKHPRKQMLGLLQNQRLQSALVHTRAKRTSIRLAMASKLDVCIVGGGPAGLAVANAVLKAVPGSTIKVLEGTDQYRTQGAGIQMDDNGWRALEAIDPQLKKRLEERLSDRVYHFIVKDHTGLLFQVPDAPPAYDHSTLKADKKDLPFVFLSAWSDIRDTLYEGLPEDVVVFGCKGTGYSLEGDPRDPTVVVHYKQKQEGGDTQQEQHINARLLIGADGFYSKIRAQFVQDGFPVFSGRITWRARLILREGDPDPTGLRQYNDTAIVFRRNNAPTGKDVHFLIYPGGKDLWVWALSSPVSRLEELGYKVDPAKPQGSVHHADRTGTRDIKQCCLDILQDFTEEARGLVEGTPAELIYETGVYKRETQTWPEEKFGDGPVTLVGDAAHTSPLGGQGMQQSFEDAAVLGWYLQQHGLTQEALRAYEKERLPRVKEVFSLNVPDSHPEKARILAKFQPHPLGVEVSAPK